jgi:hypothetical protein
MQAGVSVFGWVAQTCFITQLAGAESKLTLALDDQMSTGTASKLYIHQVLDWAAEVSTG